MADREIGSFTPEQCRALWVDYQERQQSHRRANEPKRRPIDEPSPHRIFVRNVSGQNIPPYACMEVTGTGEVGGRALVLVRQPQSICSEYVFNGPYEIEADANGWAYAWGLVRMLGTFGGFSACKRYTAKPGYWTIEEGPGPFLVYGTDVLGEGVLIGRVVGDHCKARYILFEYTPGMEGFPSSLDAYWDGQDPTQCGENEIDYPLGQPCKATKMVAVHDPNEDIYHAVISPSATLGEPDRKNVVISQYFDGCCLNYATESILAFTGGCTAGGDNPEEAIPEITFRSTCPTMVQVPVVMSIGIVGTGYTCSGNCTFEFGETLENPEGEWYVYEPCGGSDCECPPKPTDTPELGTRREVACVRKSPTASGLVANTAYITTCSYVAGNPIAIPITECPPA